MRLYQEYIPHAVAREMHECMLTGSSIKMNANEMETMYIQTNTQAQSTSHWLKTQALAYVIIVTRNVETVR